MFLDIRHLCLTRCILLKELMHDSVIIKESLKDSSLYKNKTKCICMTILIFQLLIFLSQLCFIFFFTQFTSNDFKMFWLNIADIINWCWIHFDLNSNIKQNSKSTQCKNLSHNIKVGLYVYQNKFRDHFLYLINYIRHI